MSDHRKPACFQKLIMDSSIVGNNKLRIPDKFVKKFGDELSSVARLIVPNGLAWHVRLEKTGNKLWFHDGWQVFVKYYTITAGYYLIFKYEGKSNFNVFIFDLTAAEINYQPKTPITLEEHNQHGQRPMTHEKEMEDDDCVEILSSSHPCLPHIRLENKSEMSDSQSSFSGKTIEASQHLITNPDFSKDEEELIAANGVNQITETSDGCELAARHEDAGKNFQTDSSRNIGNTGVLAANSFKSDNPICRVIMQQSYMHSWSSVYIPCEFAARYLSESTDFVTLEVSNMKKWSVRCIHKEHRARLGKGWHDFVLGNNLKIGDVCVFELIDRKTAVLKVTIFCNHEM